jgi:hypothetical protein
MSKVALNTLPRYAHSKDTYLQEQYVLRACNRDYRAQTNKYRSSLDPPELDGCKQLGKVAPLTTFETTYGHCSDGLTRIFPPMHHSCLRDWLQYLQHYISNTMNKKHTWDLDGVQLVSVDAILDPRKDYSDNLRKCIQAQITHKHNPISVYSAQAYVESKDKRGKGDYIYKAPSQSTLMTGILGGINNNTTIEMGFEEEEGERNMDKRTYKDDMFGFICCGHTAHSEDAGKSRRIASFTRVRVFSNTALWMALDSDNVTISSSGSWTVYCMGSTFSTDLAGVVVLVQKMNGELRRYAKSQFSYPDNSQMAAPPTYVVYYHEKLLIVSISPGVVLRMMPNGMMIDSTMYHYQPANPITRHGKIPNSGTDSIKYKYSAFFLLCPYVQDDRPPRTLLASGQTVQAICMPWAPATAKVSPCHVSRPLVTTEFMRRIQEDQESNPDAMWDILPGEDMMICFVNHPLNYDDAMVVSSKFADFGGFETLSVCTYRLFAKDNIPIVGEELCGKKYEWWKVPCTNHCVCQPWYKKVGDKLGKIKRIISDPRIPSGIVTESNIAENGEYQIRVLSHSQLLTGDKISTTHGQKGVVRVVPFYDLPMIVMPDGSSFTADLYMAVGSVTSRQTVGQILESSAALKAAREGHMNKVEDPLEQGTEECEYLISGETGRVIVSALPDGKVVPIKASVGITRVFNQTQLTRERHHLSHMSEGKYSLGTTSGRAAGGGVATAEMDFHAMFSSGMLNCAQELLNRGNVVRVNICIQCKHVEPLCDCNTPGRRVPTRLSYDTVIFDILSACINGSANTYEVAHA